MSFYLLKSLPKMEFQSGPRKLNKGEVYDVEKEVGSKSTFFHLTPSSGGTTVTITEDEFNELNSPPNNPKFVPISKSDDEDDVELNMAKVRPSLSPESTRPAQDPAGYDHWSLYGGGRPEQDYKAVSASNINISTKTADIVISFEYFQRMLQYAAELSSMIADKLDDASTSNYYARLLYDLWVKDGYPKDLASWISSAYERLESSEQEDYPMDIDAMNELVMSKYSDARLPSEIWDKIVNLDAVWKDQSAGGLGDKRSPLDFDKEQLIEGVLVELEHTNNFTLSLEIAVDHLTENPNYYTDLRKISMFNLKKKELAKEGSGIKVYLDDLRETPDGWTRTYTVDETIDLIRQGNVSVVSLDNDLGEDLDEGYKVAQWIEEQTYTDDSFTPPQIIVHSANPVRRNEMEQAILSIQRALEKRSLDTNFIKICSDVDVIRDLSKIQSTPTVCSKCGAINDIMCPKCSANFVRFIDGPFRSQLFCMYCSEYFPEDAVTCGTCGVRDSVLELNDDFISTASLSKKAGLIDEIISKFDVFKRANPAEISRGTKEHTMQEIIQFSKDHAAEFVTEANKWFSSDSNFQAQIVKLFAGYAIPFGAKTLQWMWDTIAKEGLNFFVNFGNFAPLAPKEASNEISLFKVAYRFGRFWYKNRKLEWLSGIEDDHMLYMWNNHRDVVDPEHKYASAKNFTDREGLCNYDKAFDAGYVRGIVDGDTLILNHSSLTNSAHINKVAREILDAIDDEDTDRFAILRNVEIDPSTYGKPMQSFVLKVKDIYGSNIQQHADEFFDREDFNEVTPGSMWLDRIYREKGVAKMNIPMLKLAEGKAITLEDVIKKYGDDPDRVAINRDDTYGKAEVMVRGDKGDIRFTFQYGVLQSFNDEPAIYAITDSGQELREWHDQGRRNRSGDKPARIWSVFGQAEIQEVWHDGVLEKKMFWDDEENKWIEEDMRDAEELKPTNDVGYTKDDEDFLRGLGISPTAYLKHSIIKLANDSGDNFLKESIKFINNL